MAESTINQVLSQGQVLPNDPERFGTLRESNDVLGDWDALNTRMADDGYVFLRGYLNEDDVLAARLAMLARIQGEGGLDDDAPLVEGVVKPGVRVQFRHDRTRRSPELRRLLFDGPMVAFFEGFLDGEVRPLDNIWLRSVCPGKGTAPHGDSVFMNRGTLQLYTAWTPLGEIDTHLGGLIVLEGSHKLEDVRETYGSRDVDTYCEDDPDAETYRTTGGWPWNGQISDNPVELRNQLGGRWLTADYRPGDVLFFTMFTLHASLDNQSADRIRLSTDTRYQLASEPVDPRWIGDDPIAHGPEAKQSIIC